VNAFSDLYTSYLRITLSSNSNGGFPTPDKSNFPRWTWRCALNILSARNFAFLCQRPRSTPTWKSEFTRHLDSLAQRIDFVRARLPSRLSRSVNIINNHLFHRYFLSLNKTVSLFNSQCRPRNAEQGRRRIARTRATLMTRSDSERVRNWKKAPLGTKPLSRQTFTRKGEETSPPWGSLSHRLDARRLSPRRSVLARARARARRSNFPESFSAGVNWKYKLQIRDAGPGSILRGREAAGWSSRIVLKWAVAREVSQLCPERDAPTDQLSRLRLKSASLSLFRFFFLSFLRPSRYSQGAATFPPRGKPVREQASRVHYAPAYGHRYARHEAFAVSGNISAAPAAKVSLSASRFGGCLSAREAWNARPKFRGRLFPEYASPQLAQPRCGGSPEGEIRLIRNFVQRAREFANYDGSIKIKGDKKGYTRRGNFAAKLVRA